jgi:type II secretory pathway pseudopilin PulG
MSSSFSQRNKNSGLTLIEVLIGIFLLLMVFISIFILIQLSIKLTNQSKARISATALANQKLELARNLPYNQLGTVGGIPAGSIPETEIIDRNGIAYTVKTTAIYVDDPFDGSFPNDSLAWDYKRIRIEVSWSKFLGGEVFLQTDVTPKGIETTGGGGIISILVFDANGQPVPQAEIQIENNDVVPPISVNYETDNQGRLFVPGAPACNDCYKIIAGKINYSLERTYATGEVVRGQILTLPIKPFLSVIEGQLSEISFSIDQLADKTIQTIRYVEEKTWSDSFNNETKVAEKSQVIVDASLFEVKLEEQGGQYPNSGYLISSTITPSGLVEWGRLNWNDETPFSTEIKYQVLYYNGTDWILIPDEDLTINGVLNSEGFSDSPIDLSQLDDFKYKSVRLKTNFSTTDQTQTPRLFDWEITWFSSDTSIPIPNLAFTMQGAKTLGTDADGQPIYKYQESLITNSGGQLSISDLEWDSYGITISGATGYDIANSFPPQPVNINPGVNQTVIIKLANHQPNSLLVTVKDSAGQPLIGANVRLYRIGYDKTKLSTDSGQAFYSSLVQAIYNLEVKLAGCSDYLSPIDVSGTIEQVVIMTVP